MTNYILGALVGLGFGVIIMALVMTYNEPSPTSLLGYSEGYTNGYNSSCHEIGHEALGDFEDREYAASYLQGNFDGSTACSTNTLK